MSVGRDIPNGWRALRRAAVLLSVGISACATSEPAANAPEPVTVGYEDARFTLVSEAHPNGPQWAVLWGDPATGPSAMLLKLVPGPVPLHVHSSDYHLVVLSGSMKHWGEEETEEASPVLGPGSYWFQPGGRIHGDACLSDECLVHIVWQDKRDAALAGS